VTKFSIVLPVRNGGEYFKSCVKSILRQTVADFNLEILDNCSEDGSVQWLQELNDNRIRIYSSDKPLTIENNWKRITAIAKNEFMTFIGHDDLLDPNYLEVMDKLISKHPSATVYQVHFRYIDANGDIVRSCKPMDEIQTAPECLAFFLSNMYELSIGHLVRSKDYDEVGGIPSYPNLLFADLELWIKLIEKSYKATSMEECCSYRIHQTSTTKSSSTLSYYHAFTRLLGFFSQLKATDQAFTVVLSRYGLDFLKLYCKSLAHHLLRVPKKNRPGLDVSKFILDYKKSIDELIPGNTYDPERIFSLKLARTIDNNALTRELFLAFKKIYSKPILK
jgi:glycosyltransferase involved in cell wall biosynthesis